MNPFALLLLVLGLLDLLLQAGTRGSARWTIPAIVLTLVGSYHSALHIGLRNIEAWLLQTHIDGFCAAACMCAWLTLGALLTRPHLRALQIGRQLWLRIATPVGLVAVAGLQWRLFHQVDGVPYPLLSTALALALAGLCGLAAFAAATDRDGINAARVAVACAQLAAAALATVAASTAPPPAALPLPGLQSLLIWPPLLLGLGLLGAALARRLHWS